MLFQETKVLKLAADNFFGKQYFFSLQRVRKLLSSDRHQFLSLFVSIGMHCKSGLRFSFWALEVLVLRVGKRPLSLSTVVFSSLLELALPKKKIKDHYRIPHFPQLMGEMAKFQWGLPFFSNYAMNPTYRTSSAVKKLLLLLYPNPGRWRSSVRTPSATA